MNKDALASTVCETAAEVMELFAFIFAERMAPEAAPAEMEEALAVRIACTGAVTGALTLAVPRSWAESLAANTLGLDDPGEAEAAAADALKELANVVCGNLVTAFVGPDAVVPLGLPRDAPAAEREWERLRAHPDTIALEADDEPVLVLWEGKTP